MAIDKPNIGILALQGDFALHAAAIDGLHCTWEYVKRTEQLSDTKAKMHGLIIPGGESTTLLKHFNYQDWMTALKNFHASGGAIFGTCAGAILLAKEVEPKQPSLELVDMCIARNAYGRQIDSFVATSHFTPTNEAIEMVFIRAPKILHVGEGVDVLVKHDEDPVLIQQGRLLACTFHPEVNSEQQLPGASSLSSPIHRYFLELAVQ